MAWRSIFETPWRRGGLIAGLVVLGLLFCLRIFVMTPIAHSIVESRVEALSVREQSVALERVHGDLLSGIRVDRLSIRDDEGVWLIAEEARVSWRILPLLFGRLDLKEIRAEVLRVDRRPNLAPSKTTSQAAPFDEYRIGNLSIAKLALAEGIAGPAQSYQIDGSLEAAGWEGLLHLDLIPTGAGGDEIKADITWGGNALLEGELDLTGAPDGVIAQLLGVPQGETFMATLDASGGMFGGELKAEAQIGRETVLNLEAGANRRTSQASGRVDLSRFERLASIAHRFGDDIEFEASLDQERHLSAKLLSPAGMFEIEGKLVSSEAGRSLENLLLTVSQLDAPRLSGVSGLTLSDLNVSGRVSQMGSKFGFDGRIETPALSYGDYSFSAVSSDGLIEFIGGTLSADTRLSLALENGVPNSVRSALGSTILAEFAGHYALPQSLLTIESASLRGDKLTLAGSGTMRPAGPIALTGSFGTRALSIIEAATGRFELTGDTFSNLELSLDGNAQPKSSAPKMLRALAPTLTYELTAARQGNGIAIEQARLRSDALAATLSGNIEPEQVELTARAEARLGDQIDGLEEPVYAQASMSGTLTEPVIGLHLNGAYRDDPVLAELTGRFQNGRVQVSDVSAEWRLLLASGQGAIELSSPQDSTFDVKINGRAQNLADLKAEISYGARELASQVSVSGFAADGVSVETADLKLAGVWPEFSGTATFQAELPVFGAPQPVAGMHPLVLNAETRSVTLEGNTEIGGQSLSIRSPLEVSANPDLRMKGVLAGFGGEIELDLDNSGEQSSQLVFKSIALGELSALLQRPGLIGTLDGSADVQLGEQGAFGSAFLQITDLSRAGLEMARASLITDVQLMDGQLAVAANVIPADEGASLEATLDTALIDSGSLLSIRQAPGALTPINVTGTGDIAPLWALAGFDVRLAGQFALDLSNGDGRSFRFSGPASLSNGVFEDGLTGAYLEDLDAKLRFDPEAITVVQASASGAKGGSITASGSYNFNGNSDLEVNLTRLRALRRQDISTTLSGQASVERRDRRAHIQGDIRIDEMRVDLSKLPRSGYTTLDVQFDNSAEDNEQSAPTREVISLDLDVRADRRVFVDGPSFESEWGIDARVRGSPNAPNLTGEALLVRGEASVIGQRFDLTEGRIQFAGAPANSELNLRADRTSDGVTTMIGLSGELTDPAITLSSDPSLPEDEVLARVLFGRSPSTLSPLQAAQLAGAAAQLAGGDAFSLTGELQDATGLDRLDFGFDDDGEALLSTGKYLSDDIYLEIESGATGAPAVALEWTPLNNVEVDAEVDPELGPKVAIQWKRDFDRLPGEPRDE
jgi:autotransporter translocation and assembly factor TamB